MTVGRYCNGLNLALLLLDDCEQIKFMKDDKEIYNNYLTLKSVKLYLPTTIKIMKYISAKRENKILYINVK